MESEPSGESLILVSGSDIDWKDLDPVKLYFNSSIFQALRTLLYPATLIKTRLQSQKVFKENLPTFSFFLELN